MTEDEEVDPEEAQDDSERETSEEDNQQETSEEESVEQEPAEVEHVESSDGDSLMDSLNGMSVEKVLLVGGVLGLLAGLVAGYAMAPSNTGIEGKPAQASQSVQELIESGRFNGTVRVGDTMNRHGMYYYNVTLEQQTVNGTQISYQPAYVTKDAQLLFPVVQNFMMTSPINIQQALTRQAAAQNQAPEGEAAQ